MRTYQFSHTDDPLKNHGIHPVKILKFIQFLTKLFSLNLNNLKTIQNKFIFTAYKKIEKFLGKNYFSMGTTFKSCSNQKE